MTTTAAGAGRGAEAKGPKTKASCKTGAMPSSKTIATQGARQRAAQDASQELANATGKPDAHEAKACRM